MPPGLEAARDRCPSCSNHYLTTPKASAGYYNPEHKGRFYQQCEANNHTDTSLCSFFRWRDDIQADLSSPRSEPCGGTLCLGRPKARLRHKQCIRQACKECCQASQQQQIVSSLVCKAPRHQVHKPNATPLLPHAAPVSTIDAKVPGSSTPRYGQMLSPTYEEKLRRNDFTLTSDENLMVHRKQYEKDHRCMITVKWWNENGKAAMTFVIAAPGFPYFHPKDSDVIVETIGRNACMFYGVFRVADQQWIITDLAQKVKPDAVLYLRSRDVTDCLGLEREMAGGQPRKRPSEDAIGPSRSTRFKPSSEKVIDLSSDDETENDAGSIPPPSSSPSNHTDDKKKSKESLGNVDLTKAPPGERGDWPLRYTCDMAAGFRSMHQLTQNRSGMKTADRFKEVFNKQWKSSTYSDHLHVWKAIPSNVLEESIAAGRTDAGEWSQLYKLYRKKANN